MLRYFGRVVRLDEQVFLQNRERIQFNNLQQRYPEINRTLNQIYSRYLRYQRIDLFNYQVKKEECPLNLLDFDRLQQEYHQKQKDTLQKQFREFLIDEVYDLGKKNKVFDCYKIDLEKYYGSEQNQFYKLIDMIFSNFIRYCIVRNTCEQYTSFIQSFVIPTTMETFKKLWVHIHQNIFSKQATIEQQRIQIINQQSIQNGILSTIRQRSIYDIKQHPLIRLNLVINLNWKKKQVQEKKKKEDEKDKNAAAKEEELHSSVPQQLIYYDPDLPAVEQILLKPFATLVATTNSFLGLEKDLITLVEIKPKVAYEINENHPDIVEAKTQILKFIKESYEEAQTILEQFKRFNFIVEKSVNSINRSLFGDSKEKSIHISSVDISSIKSKLAELSQAKIDIEQLCIDQYNGRLFQIVTKNAKEVLVQRINEQIAGILNKVSEVTYENSERLFKAYNELERKITNVPADEKELVELKNDLAEHEVNLAKLKREVYQVQNMIDIMEGQCFLYDEAKESVFWNLQQRPVQILERVSDGMKTASLKEEKLMSNLDMEKEAFDKNLRLLKQDFETIKSFKNYSDARKNASVVFQLKEKIDQSFEKVRSFNEREVLFKQPISEYQELAALQNDFVPYNKIWELSMDFDVDQDDWMNNSLQKLNYETIEKKVNQNFYKETTKLIKKFDELQDQIAGNVAYELKAHIEKFRELLWMVELLTTEAMTNRKSLVHWQEIYQRCNVA